MKILSIKTFSIRISALRLSSLNFSAWRISAKHLMGGHLLKQIFCWVPQFSHYAVCCGALTPTLFECIVTILTLLKLLQSMLILLNWPLVSHFVSVKLHFHWQSFLNCHQLKRCYWQWHTWNGHYIIDPFAALQPKLWCGYNQGS